MGAADGHVARPPADLGADHVGARPDEPEGDRGRRRRRGTPAGARCPRSPGRRRSRRSRSPRARARRRVAGARSAPTLGTRTTLPMFRRSSMKRWASAARSNGNASATTGLKAPFARPSSSGSMTRSKLPSRSHQWSMLRPKTPLFSFMIARLFHHGIVANGILTRLRSAAPMSRFPVPGLDLGEPVHDQPAAGPQHPVVAAETRRPDRIHDHVDALAVGDPHHLGGEVLGCGSRSRASTPCSRIASCLEPDAVPKISAPIPRESGWPRSRRRPAAAWISTRSPCLRPPMMTSAA